MFDTRPSLDRALQIIADDKIEAAIQAGRFDDLPGLGQPHPIFDEPYDPHAWLRKKLHRERNRPPGHRPERGDLGLAMRSHAGC